MLIFTILNLLYNSIFIGITSFFFLILTFTHLFNFIDMSIALSLDSFSVVSSLPKSYTINKTLKTAKIQNNYNNSYFIDRYSYNIITTYLDY